MGAKKYFRWMEEKTRGGKREGAGRKPVKDKAVQVTIYLKPSVIKALGGKDAVQTIMKAAVHEKWESKKKKK
jgi:hypothetical protein